jgi:hypothetical protein
MTTEKLEEQQEAEEIGRLRLALKTIAEVDVERDLVRAPDLGSASFADSRPLFQEMVQYAKKLQPLDWHKLPRKTAANLAQPAEQVVAQLQQVKGFTLEQGEPMPRRDNIASQVEASFNALREAAIPVVGYLSWESVNLDQIRADVQSLLQEATAQVGETMKQLDARRAEADEALQAIRAASALAGVAHHAEVFSAAAARHEKSASKWLIASGIAALATVFAAIALVLLWEINGDISDASVFQLVVAKGVLLAVGFFITFNCVRMYRSHTHLSVVNRHREDALRTFKAFAEGTDSSEVRDKVLLEATHAIFGQTATGFIDARDSRDTIEVLDGVVGMLRRSQ